MSISDKEAEIKAEILCRAITLNFVLINSGLPSDELTVAAMRYQASSAEHMLSLKEKFKASTMEERAKLLDDEYEKYKPVLDFIIKDMGLV